MNTPTSLIALAAFALATALPAAGQAQVLQQGFEDISDLAGWQLINESAPLGLSWFQGNPGVFAAQAGAPDAYIAANYLSAAGSGGSIDNWLITPQLTLAGPATLSFYTRTATTAGYNDTLEVLFRNGAGTGTSGFSTLLLTIGGADPYPGGWTHYSASVPGAGSGQFAFHYTGDADASNYIGIDTVSVAAVPEPAAWLMLGLGLLSCGLLQCHRKPV